MYNKVEIELSKVLSDFHKFIIENNYTKEYHDSDSICNEFMGMNYDEQVVFKNE